MKCLDDSAEHFALHFLLEYAQGLQQSFFRNGHAIASLIEHVMDFRIGDVFDFVFQVFG